MEHKTQIIIITGGHHTGSLVVAKQLQQAGVQVIWIGHRHSMWGDTSDSAEYREVTASGITFHELKAGKFYRTLHPAKLIRIPYGFIQALIILLSMKFRYGTQIKGIYSSGGYLAVPVVFCGWLLGIPSVTHEQTVVAGWANRFISFFASKIALTWPSSGSNYPKNKTVLTGLPLRSEIKNITLRRQASPPIILVIGGKQGSHAINQAVFAVLPMLLSRYKVIHQVGRNSIYQDYKTAINYTSSNYIPKEYLEDSEIAKIYSECSLVVSRSGAHTAYELAYLGIPCLFIPLPSSSHQEQLKNAQLLENARQAVILAQQDLTPDKFISSIETAIKLKPCRIEVPPNGAENVIQLIKDELLNV